MKAKFLLFIFLFIATFSFGQKRAIDADSYKEWKQVDSYSISQNGRWVIYKYTYLDNDEKNKEIKNRFYLFDNTTKKTEIMDSISNPVFCGNGGWLMYNNSTFLRLKDKKKIVRDDASPFLFGNNDDIVSYNDPKKKRFVVLNLTKGDSVVYDQTSCRNLYDNSKKIIFVKADSICPKLQYGTIGQKASYTTLFTDTTNTLKRFGFNPNTLKGTFEIGDLYYQFNLKDGSVNLLFDASVIGNAKSVELLNNSNFVAYDVYGERPQKRKDERVKDEKFNLELWSWNDEEVPSVQANGYREPTINPHKYIYNKATGKSYRISDENYNHLFFSESENSTFAFKSDESPYSMNHDWEHDARMDIYLIDLTTGENTLIVKRTTHIPKWSPNGDYIIYFSSTDRAWYSYNPRSKSAVNLSEAIGHSVYNEEYDRPNPAGSYGIAAYMKDGKSMIIYDRYDMWVVDISGKTKPYCLTKGYGRANESVIRLFNPNSVSFINLEENQKVELFNTKNMDKGFYTLTPKGKMIKNFEGPYVMKINKVSNDSKVYLYQRQSFTNDRDLWISDSEFKHNYKITEANPQQKNYKWGSVELFEWVNYDGKMNKGLLYLPEDYQKGKSYPTIVSFYETHTDKRHIYLAPTLSHAMIDITTYVSNGYIVFQPDVNFTIGKPGMSSYNAVVSGTKALIEQGMIDGNRVGLQGHSWSGYQVAYLITKTDLFKCVNVGAAIVNMTSAYNDIREGSGMPRMFMYEDWQCRMGKPMWDDREGYIENSPIFYADKIKTPALIFHCDKDEAVSYSQGRNLFLALRRLGKPAWMLNYMGEGHFLSSKQARTDWTIRMAQFFDYYLKGSDMPRWMSEGINRNERAVDKKYDLIKKR